MLARGRALAGLGMVAVFSSALHCHRDERSSLPKPRPPSAVASSTAITQYTDRVEFAVVGDYGADTPGEAAVARMIKSWNVDFVVTTGDNNYPDGAASTLDDNVGKYYSELIGNYHGRYGSGATENRFWPSAGNHDWRAPDLAPYLQYFTLPGNERYYHVDLGLVHLYAVDSDPHEPDGIAADSIQGRWLKERLAASKSCFDVVYFHHAPFSSSEHGSSVHMQWPFEEWGAEIVLAGHDHTYERVLHGKIPYLVVGLGGSSEYEFREPVANSALRYDEKFGALRVHMNRSGAHYEFWNVDGAKIDAFDAPRHCD